MTDVGDVPIQEMRACGVDDERLMQTITDAVKLVMDEVGATPSLQLFNCRSHIKYAESFTTKSGPEKVPFPGEGK